MTGRHEDTEAPEAWRDSEYGGSRVDARGAGAVLIGDGATQNNYHSRPVSSHYLAKLVEPMFARKKPQGRERELAELGDFCTADEAPPYLWWQAEAFTGKTALLSWFAVHPPESVAIVAFFLGAPSLGRRKDFIPTALKQLDGLKLKGVEVPEINTADITDLWATLDQAAHACSDLHRRLVLLVDGLDEDDDVDGCGIAGLLPGVLQDGMRVVVSSRPQDRILAALSDNPGHPLHDPDIVRKLRHSPHAEAVKEKATNAGFRSGKSTPLR